jgi:hypothetical protein
MFNNFIDVVTCAAGELVMLKNHLDVYLAEDLGELSEEGIKVIDVKLSSLELTSLAKRIGSLRLLFHVVHAPSLGLSLDFKLQLLDLIFEIRKKIVCSPNK